MISHPKPTDRKTTTDSPTSAENFTPDVFPNAYAEASQASASKREPMHWDASGKPRMAAKNAPHHSNSCLPSESPNHLPVTVQGDGSKASGMLSSPPAPIIRSCYRYVLPIDTYFPTIAAGAMAMSVSDTSTCCSRHP